METTSNMSSPLKDEISSSTKTGTDTTVIEIIWKIFSIVAIVGTILLIRIFWVLRKIQQRRRRRRRTTQSSSSSSSSSSSRSTRSTTNDTNYTAADNVSEARKTVPKPVKTMVVLGSGGHTTEMLQLIKNLDPKLYRPFVVVVASTDTTSISRVEAYPHPLPVNVDRKVSSNSNQNEQDGDENETKTAETPVPPSKVYKIPRSREVGQSYSSSVVTTLYSFIFAMKMALVENPDLVLVNGPGTCLPVAVSAFLLRIVGYNTSCKIVFVESFCRVKSLSLTGRLLYPIADLFLVCWEELLEIYPNTMLVTTFVPPTTTTAASAGSSNSNTEEEEKKKKSE